MSVAEDGDTAGMRSVPWWGTGAKMGSTHPTAGADIPKSPPKAQGRREAAFAQNPLLHHPNPPQEHPKGTGTGAWGCQPPWGSPAAPSHPTATPCPSSPAPAPCIPEIQQLNGSRKDWGGPNVLSPKETCSDQVADVKNLREG